MGVPRFVVALPASLVLAHCGLDVVGQAASDDHGSDGAPLGGDSAGGDEPDGDEADGRAKEDAVAMTSPILRFLPDGVATFTAPTATIDLTASGSADWSAWGAQGSSAQHHKSLARSLISDIDRSNPPSIVAGAGNFSWPFDVKWTDGDPTAATATTKEFVYTEAQFSFTVATSPSPRKLTIHMAAYTALVRLTATMSSGARPPLTATLETTTAFQAREISLELASPTQGDTLKIDLVKVEPRGAAQGAVDLIAATLADE